MSWHTKYRPRAVKDLHLTEVRTVLQKLMKSGSFPQVFLCAGPKGTGKTSTSRIIGAMLNDPKNEQAVQSLFFGKNPTKKAELVEPDPDSELANKIFSGNSFIVQEMDAASNRGIDDVRQLKERVSLPPQQALMSVYILDEVHMLTNEAFNALLKLLEEPPEHAVFILATTEVHKVPDTVQSRCTVLPFRKATTEELVTALERVIKLEKINIDDQAVEAIAVYADGSFRDGIKYLEMIANSHQSKKTIAKKEVEETLQTSFSQHLPTIIDAVVSKDQQALAALFTQLRAEGVVSNTLHTGLIDYLHKQLLEAITKGDDKAAYNQRISHFLLTQLQELPTVSVEPLPLLSLELKLLEIIYRAQDRSGSDSNSNQSSNNNQSKSTPKKIVTKATKAAASAIAAQPSEPIEPTLETTQLMPAIEMEDEISLHQNLEVPDHIDTRPLLQAWAEFVASVEATNSTLAAVLRSAKPLPEKSNGIAKIEVYYPFHRDQLMQPKFLTVLQDCAVQFIGGRPAFEFIIGKASVSSAEQNDTSSTEASSDLAAIADSILM